MINDVVKITHNSINYCGRIAEIDYKLLNKKIHKDLYEIKNSRISNE